MPNKSQIYKFMDGSSNSKQCRNCGAPLSEGDKFCAACGQKNTDGRFTFRELMANLADNLFSLDARIIQTVSALIRPGKLTESFFQGKHVRYYHPVRLFIFSAAVLIAISSVVISKDELSTVDDGWQQRREYVEQQKLHAKVDSMLLDVKASTDDTLTLAAVDTFSARFKGPLPQFDLDSLPLGPIVHIGTDTRGSGTMMSFDDIVTLPVDSLCNKYGVEGIYDRFMIAQSIRIIRSPSGFIFHLIGNMVWMMLIMMPMLALVLKVFYIRSRFLYYEHLIFSFHIHTFLFLVTSVFLLLQFGVGGNVFWISVPILLVYPLLAIKRFYKQSWWKTILKSFIVSLLYLLILALSFMILIFGSMFLF